MNFGENSLLVSIIKAKIVTYSLAYLAILILGIGGHVQAQPLNDSKQSSAVAIRREIHLYDQTSQKVGTTVSVETRLGSKRPTPRVGEVFEPTKAQILIQSNLIKTEGLSLAATVLTQAAGTAASVATGGIGGPLVSAAVKATTRATLKDENAITYIPTDPFILNEVIRFSECFAVENSRSISSVHLIPSALKYSAPKEWSDSRDLLRHWEAHLELNSSWTIADDTEEIIWFFNTLEVPEGFSFKALEDIRLLSASGFRLILKLSTMEMELLEMEPLRKAAYTKSKFGDFLSRFFRSHTPQMPHPECGTRSLVLRKLDAEINQNSTLSDLEEFFRDLGVKYERDRSKRRLIGIMRPSADEGHRIDFPVKIELSYTRRPRRFERALVSNFRD